jgi:hypothetical protein
MVIEQESRERQPDKTRYDRDRGGHQSDTDRAHGMNHGFRRAEQQRYPARQIVLCQEMHGVVHDDADGDGPHDCC